VETTLDQVNVGQKATVVLAGHRTQTAAITATRLLHQGIVTGAVVEVIRRTTGGGTILAVGRSRVALDPGVLQDIVVVEGTPSHFTALRQRAE
jgi:Fe2+ transport system protein FeoA